MSRKSALFCGGANRSIKKFKSIRKEKEKAREAGGSEKRRMERTPQKFCRCRFEDHLIAKFPKPPKDNDKRRKQVRFSERGNCSSHK